MAQERVPPGQTVTGRFPVLHHGQVPSLRLEDWRLRLYGEVEEEVELDWEQLLALPTTRVTADIHCVTGWSKLDTEWEGVSTRQLLRLVQLTPQARYVMVHAPGGWSTNLSLDDFCKENVVLARSFDGAPITREHGWPVRLVVPHLYFWKSAKWVTALEFIWKDRPGFWEEAGYHLRGDPWTEQRYRDDRNWLLGR
ncbi:MAG: sulfite oxidase-like oxidoreductase [Bacillota bacterium]